MIFKKNAIIFSLLLSSLSMPGKVQAAPARQECCGSCNKCHILAPAEAKAIIKGLGEVKDVRMSPVKGLWELRLERDGREGIAYLDFSKKYILPGPVFDLASGNRHDAPQREQARKIDVSGIPLADSVIMGNPNGKKKLFVFTDPECPYCARQHAELKKLVAADNTVAVYVKMFPLKMHAHAYDKARVILGSKSLDMLDKAFERRTLPPPGPGDLSKPVDDTVRFADSIGINSTPTLILPDGRILPGLKDSESLARLLTGKN